MKPPALLPGEDLFTWKGITIHQNELVLKVGTDALLLGEWVPRVVREASAILDIGTGTGILALLMAKAYPAARVMAIDSDLKATELAHQNAMANNLHDRLKLKAITLEHYAALHPQHDLIVCNPPYFHQQLLPASPVMKEAKHAAVSIQDWVKPMVNLMTYNASVCLVLPSAGAQDWTREFNQYNVYCKSRLDIFSFRPDTKPKRSLVHFSKALVKPEIQQMVMFTADQQPTAEYTEWLQA